MADSENLQKLKGILSTCANIIREAEGNNDPVLVSEMRERIALCNTMRYGISGNTINRAYFYSYFSDPTTPQDTVDYYRKLLSNLAKRVKPNSSSASKIGIDTIIAEASKICGIETNDGKYTLTFPKSSTITHIGSIWDGFNRIYSQIHAINFPSNITTIGRGAFSNLGIASLDFPSTLTTIGSYAFSWCSKLSQINFNSSISIGAGAFLNCESLEQINLSQANYIGDAAFENCINLSSIIAFPSSSSINFGYGVFANCGFTEITVPAWWLVKNGFTYRTFSGCRQLSSITISPSSDTVFVHEGCVFTKAMHLAYLIQGLNNGNIPSTCSNYSFYGISDCAFAGMPMSSITIPAVVNTIGSGAFYACPNLTTIIWDNSGYNEKKIYQYAFASCSQLTNIDLPLRCRSVEEYAFADCINLSSINISSYCTLSSIGAYAFANCPFSDFTIPFSCSTIYRNAFNGCSNLQHISLYYSGTVAEIAEDYNYYQGVIENLLPEYEDLSVTIYTEYDYPVDTTLGQIYEGGGGGGGSGSGSGSGY